MKAIWNGQIIAESDQTIIVEKNHYFPEDSVSKEYLEQSKKQTVCPWKGSASYVHLVVEGKINKNAAWYYPQPKPAAREIKNYFAFWKGVQVIND